MPKTRPSRWVVAAVSVGVVMPLVSAAAFVVINQAWTIGAAVLWIQGLVTACTAVLIYEIRHLRVGVEVKLMHHHSDDEEEDGHLINWGAIGVPDQPSKKPN